MSHLRAYGLLLLGASACAGSSFELADDPAQGGGGFPPLETNDNLGGLGGDGGAAAGTAGTGGAAGSAGSGGAAGSAGAGGAAPVISACGELRATGLDDAEICIPAGAFTMGSASDRVPQGYAAHGPEHQVTLAAYVLDAFEVTVARYRTCVGAGTCRAPSTATEQGCTYSEAAGDRDRLPVTCVSWGDADDFCTWDGGRRLPTEAEWERAARGTTGTTYAWGNDVACNKGVFGGSNQCDEHAGSLPKAVGSEARGASAEGAMDLTGNAWEWVADWFGAYPNGSVESPVGPNTGSGRIQRGGNWQTPPIDAAAFMRRSLDPDANTPPAPWSFRCAHSVP
jgi:formylglycine-generating enzyme required for sulfatase activity